MNREHDTDLNAYVDGELDHRATQEFEARLFCEPHLLRQVRKIRAQNQLLRAAYQSKRIDGTLAPSARPLHARLQSKSLPTIAATLIVGLATGFVAANWQQSATRSHAESPRDAALQRTLETVGSGSAVRWRDDLSAEQGQIHPVSTYRNASGEFCREFEELRSHNGHSSKEGGVACRMHNGTWRVRIRYYL